MSLILEALRKSEAQRRRAQVPDLFAEPASAPTLSPAAPDRRLWWGLLAGAVLLLAGWLSRDAWNTRADRDAAAAAVSAPTAVAITSQPPRPAAALSGLPAPPDRAVAQSPSVAPAEVQAQIAGVPASAAIVTPTPATAAGAQTRTAADPRPPSALTPAPASAPPPAAPRALATPATPPIATPSVSAAASDDIAPVALTSLGRDERAQLPALKMSMHLWNADAAQRFVIVDGQRLAEGDRAGDAVIETITPSGVILGWQGRRLSLPIR